MSTLLNLINDRLNDYMPPTTAADIVRGDQINLGEWITVTDARPTVDGRIRITGTRGDWGTPGDVVTLRIATDATIRKAAR